MNNRIEILDLPEQMRTLVAEAELSGRRTLLERNGKAVSILLSFDEYVALRESIDIANDAVLRERITSARDEVRRNRILLIDDLLEGEEAFPGDWNDRLRFPESMKAEWLALSPDEHAIARGLLQKIDDDPIAGAPLLDPLRGLWTARAHHIRVVYEIMPEARFVVVLSIARAETIE